MSKVTDYIAAHTYDTLDSWDQTFDLLLEQDGLTILGVRMNPVRCVLPCYVVRHVDKDGDLFERTTYSFKKAFSLYRQALKFAETDQ